MPIIRPSADLRNSYNEISKICHNTNKPVFITKNGYNDLVILSNELYEKLTEENVEKMIAKKFDEKYADLEEFKTKVYEKLKESIKEIEEGKGIPMDEAVAEMEELYGGD